MSYARSPRPVCSMTMGTRLACIQDRSAWDTGEIVPALFRNGNFLAARLWHDPCGRQHPLERPLPPETDPHRRLRLRALIERPCAIRRLLLLCHQALDLTRHLVVVGREALPLGHGV